MTGHGEAAHHRPPVLAGTSSNPPPHPQTFTRSGALQDRTGQVAPSVEPTVDSPPELLRAQARRQLAQDTGPGLATAEGRKA